MGADFVSTVAVVVTSPMRLHNRSHSRGDVLHLSPAEAAAAVGSGRAKLKDPADRAKCDDALRTERDRTLAACGRVPQELLRFGGRW
jgi:hypothetical protein